MSITVRLQKMNTTLSNGIASYSVRADGSDIAITNDSYVSIRDTGIRICVSCNQRVSSLLAQGFCFRCFKTSPENSECIIRPELCEAHLGKGRDVEWEQRNHNQPHHVYIAESGGLKVGVTRSTQIPTRWIDQGASKAAIFASTPNRYLAGAIEVALKEWIGDKTNWQRMLKGESASMSLVEKYADLYKIAQNSWGDYLARQCEIVTIHYPVTRYPVSVKSIKIDKFPKIDGQLIGIRGQYLLFDDNRVLNIRNHSGYQIELTVK